MLQIKFRAMGCQMRAFVDSDDAQAASALARVPTWFAEWERILSRFDPSSELSALNRSTGRAVPSSNVLWEVLQQSLAAARVSDGLVTPTVLDALETAGYDRTFEALEQYPDGPRADPKNFRKPFGSRRLSEFACDADWRNVECDEARRTVRVPPGVRLDFGGVAKGWAADEVTRRLAASGPALVDAGGDVAVSGARADGGAWSIGVADPLALDSDLATLSLVRGAVATSGTDYRRWMLRGTLQHHIIDPRTGRPADTDILSATAVAPTAVQAEVAAKTMLILGSVAGMEWVERRSEGAGLAVLNDGHVIASKRMGKFVEWTSDR